MAPIIRPAEVYELQAAQDLIVESINELTGRHGFGAIASARPAVFQLYSFADDAAGFWVAEDEGELVGSAFSWVCDDLWFLAELFVAPRMQGSGVGRELLRRAFQHADLGGAKTRALITFAFNTVSQGLYLRHGMFPRVPIYMFSVEREALPKGGAGRELEFTRAEWSEPDLARLVDIDRSVLGVSREKHHKYLLGDPTTRGYLIHRDGVSVGYAYVSSGGHVGPLAVTGAEAMGPALRAALSIAADGGAERVSAFVPGASEAALAVAAEHRMRITLPMVLQSDRPFGDWSRYLPRNPGFM